MNFIAALLLIAGLIFFTGGSVGIIRMPDFYTRLHPAGKLDTMGQLLAMAAMAIFSISDFSIESMLTGLKIIMISALVFITSPAATHAIMDAGVRAGLTPWTKTERRDDYDLGA